MLEILLRYIIRFFPGIVLGVSLLCLMPKKQTGIRILIYIGLFILTRDAMTPMDLWRFGTEGFLWIRFINDPGVVIMIGVMGAGSVVAMNIAEKDLKDLVVWHKGNVYKSVIYGIGGALVVATPLLLTYLSVPMDLRGGQPPTSMIFPILIVCLLGNLYEEILFRGYFQGYMEKTVPPMKAALLSGVLFGFGHSFLSITVTDVGWPLLLFATYEGIIAGLVRSKHGVIGATLTHGLAIFLLTSGLL